MWLGRSQLDALIYRWNSTHALSQATNNFKVLEPKITQSDFLSYEFRNQGIPDIVFLYIYMIFGDRILSYFASSVMNLKFQNTYFEYTAEHGLYLRHEY